MDSRQCHVCGQIFVNINMVMTHLSSHSRKQIYECVVAFKSSLEIFMKQYYALKKHVDKTMMQANNHNHDPEDRSQIGLPVDTIETRSQLPSVNSLPGDSIGSRSQLPSDDAMESRSQVPTKYRNGRSRSHSDRGPTFKDNFVDLTEVEIKQELDPHDEYFMKSFSEYDNYDTAKSEENNQVFSDDTQDDHSMKSGGNVAVIDLSDRQRNNDSHNQQQTINSEDEYLMNDFQAKKSSKQKYDQDMESVARNIKDRISSQPRLKATVVPPLTTRALQMLAKEISLKSKNNTNLSETTCIQCGRTFSTKFVLRRHMMSHTGERTHACPICGKGFIGKQNMMVHIRVHTGEKPYKCMSCGQQFSQYGTLYRHRKRHMVNGDTKVTSRLCL